MIFVRSFLNIRSVSCPGAAGGVSDWGDFLCKYIFLVTCNWFIHHSFIVTYFTIKVYWSSLLIIDNYKLWTMHYSTNEHKNSNGCSLCKIYIPTINHLLEESSVLKVNNKMMSWTEQHSWWSWFKLEASLRSEQQMRWGNGASNLCNSGGDTKHIKKAFPSLWLRKKLNQKQ